MNQYETVFILTPVLSDVQMKELIQSKRNLRVSISCLSLRRIRLLSQSWKSIIAGMNVSSVS